MRHPDHELDTTPAGAPGVVGLPATPVLDLELCSGTFESFGMLFGERVCIGAAHHRTVRSLSVRPLGISMSSTDPASRFATVASNGAAWGSVG